jgi:hypothetical protein
LRLPFHTASELGLEYNTSPFTISAILLLVDQIDWPIVLVLQATEKLDAPESWVKLTKYG